MTLNDLKNDETDTCQFEDGLTDRVEIEWQVEVRDEQLVADLRREFEQLSKHVGSRFFRSGFAQRQVKRERPGCCRAESVGSVKVGGFFVQRVGQQHAHSQFCSQA